MRQKRPDSESSLFCASLEQILTSDHPLLILGRKMDRSQFEELAAQIYSDEGRPGCDTRLMIGLLYLKHAVDQSDESVVARWVESVYWQAFCGIQEIRHDCPIDLSSLSRWRKRVGADRL